MKTRKVENKNFIFDVEFVPWEDTPFYNDHQEHEDNIKVKNDKISANESLNRTFNSIAYSGQMIANHPFWGNLIFDTANLKAKQEIPILLNHDHTKIAGQGTVMVQNSVIKVDGKLFKTSQWAKEISNYADEGFKWQQSVHIEPEYVETIKPDQQITVNGQKFSGINLTVFKNSTIKETSFVALGADSNTSANIFSDINKLIIIEERTPSMETKAMFTFKDGKFLPAEAGDYSVSEEDFTFACSCETETKFDDAEIIEDLEKQIKDLKDQLKEMKKNKKFEDLSKIESDLETTFSESTRDILATYNDDQLKAFVADIMNSKRFKAAQPNEKLFSAAPEGKPLAIELKNPKNPKEITDKARELIKKYEMEGKKLDFTKAVAIVSGKLET